jgi:hypothetical protein
MKMVWSRDLQRPILVQKSAISNQQSAIAENTPEAGEQWQTIALKPEGEKPKPKTFVFVDDRYVKIVSDEVDPAAPRVSFHYEPKDPSNPVHVKAAKDGQKNLDDFQSGLNEGVGKQLYDFSIGAGLKSAGFVWHNSYGRMWNKVTGNTAEIKRKDAEIANIKQDIKQIPSLMANAFAYVAANPKAAASAALHAPFEHAQSLIDQGKVKEAGEFWGRALASVPLAIYSGVGSVTALRNLPKMVKAGKKLIKTAKIGVMRLPKGIGKEGGRLPKANVPIVGTVAIAVTNRVFLNRNKDIFVKNILDKIYIPKNNHRPLDISLQGTEANCKAKILKLFDPKLSVEQNILKAEEHFLRDISYVKLVNIALKHNLLFDKNKEDVVNVIISVIPNSIKSKADLSRIVTSLEKDIDVWKKLNRNYLISPQVNTQLKRQIFGYNYPDRIKDIDVPFSKIAAKYEAALISRSEAAKISVKVNLTFKKVEPHELISKIDIYNVAIRHKITPDHALQKLRDINKRIFENMAWYNFPERDFSISKYSLSVNPAKTSMPEQRLNRMQELQNKLVASDKLNPTAVWLNKIADPVKMYPDERNMFVQIGKQLSLEERELLVSFAEHVSSSKYNGTATFGDVGFVVPHIYELDSVPHNSKITNRESLINYLRQHTPVK